jgi:hypothetical protein
MERQRPSVAKVNSTERRVADGTAMTVLTAENPSGRHGDSAGRLHAIDKKVAALDYGRARVGVVRCERQVTPLRFAKATGAIH